MPRTLLPYLLCLTVLFASAAPVVSQSHSAHKTLVRSEDYILFKDKFEVLASDTTVRHGVYTRSYKGNVIERGRYSHGRRVGKWAFMNRQKNVELRYDYNTQSPTYILPHVGKDYSQETYPAIYLGSPLVPFYFLLNYCYYPKAEADNKAGGTVVLRLKINAQGRMTGFKIASASTPNFARVVRQAAEKIPVDEWEWVPALYNGSAVPDDYDITIMFDN